MGRALEEKIMKDFCVNEFNIQSSKLFEGAQLFDVALSKKVLDKCEEYDVAVLGIEGFIVLEGRRIPDMNCIADFSELIEIAGGDFPKCSRKAAIKFIEEFVDHDTLVEFVLVKFQEGE